MIDFTPAQVITDFQVFPIWNAVRTELMRLVKWELKMAKELPDE